MIVFDLDGTLALDHHRRHHLIREFGKEKDWDSYFAACGSDTYNEPIAAVAQALYLCGHHLQIWSGRSKAYEKETIKWLDQHVCFHYFQSIRMREADDRTQDTDLKRSWLREQQLTDDPVTLVFEDRSRVVAMWREEGIVCCQVAPGDF